MTIFNTKIISVEIINEIIYRVFLVPIGSFKFYAGQYLMLIINKNNKLPLSIASIPSNNKKIELHIGLSRLNLDIIQKIKKKLNQKNIFVDLPYGNAWFRKKSNKPILLIAGGTGFSYTYSIMQAALKENKNRSISLYWGGRELKHLYLLKEIKNISKKYPNTKIFPIIEKNHKKWRGKVGKVLNFILNDFNNLSQYEIYIAGPNIMIKKAKTIFLREKNVNLNYFYGDALEFV